MKDLGKAKTIIGWQITKDTKTNTMKIDQSVFIRDHVIEKALIKCNANIIPIKAGLVIEITEPEDYKKIEVQKY